MAEADVVIVGAGPAGLAAALALADSGLEVIHLEARDRIGGRSLTVDIGGHKGIDLGAHWLHAKRANPLAREAKRLRIALNTADRRPIVIDGDQTLGAWGQMRLWRAWRKIDRGIIRLAEDRPAAAADLAVDRNDRWQVLAGELHGNHACGTSLGNVSVEDFSNALDSEDCFVEGGFGSLVAASGRGASPRLGVTVTSVRQIAQGLVLGTSAGDISARAVLMTIPSTLIVNGSITFDPVLPDSHRTAADDLPHGAYERLVFTLGDDPFSDERDRAVILLNDRIKSFYMLAGAGGPGVHFADFGGDEARLLAREGIDALAGAVAERLNAQLGSAVAKSLKPLRGSQWSADPLSLGGWSVARPGRAKARLLLRTPVAERIWFAGEATSVEQWGTVGGAWLEGERAAAEIRRFLIGRHRLPSMADRLSLGIRRPPKTRPRNLT
jgi:monoamine oxidase